MTVTSHLESYELAVASKDELSVFRFHQRPAGNFTQTTDNWKAGDENRTHITSLEGWSFTIKLHPQRSELSVASFQLSVNKRLLTF